MADRWKVLKQYGQYRSGSCVTAIVVRNTFKTAVLADQMGSKHAMYDKSRWDQGIRQWGLHDVDVGAIVSIKHPYPWLVSMANFNMSRRNQNRRRPRRHPGNDSPEKVDCRVSGLCMNYNETYKSWMEVPCKTHFVRYEKLLTNVQEVMDGVRDCFGLTQVNTPALPKETIGPGERVLHSSIFDPTFYTDERYMEMLNAEDKTIIDESIDWAQLERFGYVKT